MSVDSDFERILDGLPQYSRLMFEGRSTPQSPHVYDKAEYLDLSSKILTVQ